MGKFIGDLIVQEVDANNWLLIEPIVYICSDGTAITVPTEFDTDFYSVPRPFWSLFPRDGKGKKAAVVHDYLYGKQGKLPDGPKLSRKRCDEIFLEAMKDEGVSWWRRHTMYRAVNIFGGFAWNN